MEILTPILMHLTNLRQKSMETYLENQSKKAKRTCTVHVSTSRIDKHFPHDDYYHLNKWYTASPDECVDILNNHDVWGFMGVDN